MKITSLNFYNDFKCLAGNCHHTCCAYWEINIDKKALLHYSKIKGDFSERIKQSVNFEKSCFNKVDDRCAFLNNKNLCDLIINLGEKSLCTVCREHPRYRNYFNSHIEMGYGLCCEVVANNVIDYKDKVKENTIRKGVPLRIDKRFQKEILKIKQKIFEILGEDISFSEKTDKILSQINVKKEDILLKEYSSILSQMEILNKDFKNAINLLDKKLEIKVRKEHEKSLENLLYYFIHRHLANSIDILDIKTRIVFSIVSVLIIENISRNLTKNDSEFKNNLKEIAREYSVEIEYSDDNYYKFLDKIDEILK